MRGIIFDLDDTLYPRSQYLRSGFAVVATYVAESWRRERERALTTLMNAHLAGGVRREFQVLCEEQRLPLSLVPALVRLFRAHTPALALDADVRSTLSVLKSRGWRLGVLTNGDPAVQRRKVAALGLDAVVDAIVYAEEHAPCGKPHPVVFQTMLARLALPVSRCVVVGDDPVCDVAGAREAGLATIRVIVPGVERRLPGRADADAIVTAIAQVPCVAESLVREEPDAA